jgi:hypothetical protein
VVGAVIKVVAVCGRTASASIPVDNHRLGWPPNIEDSAARMTADRGASRRARVAMAIVDNDLPTEVAGELANSIASALSREARLVGTADIATDAQPSLTKSATTA